MHHPRRTLAAATLVLAFGGLLAGCSSTKLDDAPVESRNVPADSAARAGAGAGGSGTAQSNVATVDLSKQGGGAAAGLLAQRTVFFDFDSFVVKDEYRPMLEAHAKVLSANRSKRMMLEGHTDERGSREYNLALGQKRAEAVLRSMVLLGVQDAQLEAVSFGEERPAMPGSDEASWAKNRRVELKDR
ncbi:MAG TPA: peptidoglycan-associated lipoprotein Pal [Rubrivivax sp.]|nr:peptidoglycan-associated lipoprotein Pal [Rubrivivax sp.]